MTYFRGGVCLHFLLWGGMVLAPAVLGVLDIVGVEGVVQLAKTLWNNGIFS